MSKGFKHLSVLHRLWSFEAAVSIGSKTRIQPSNAPRSLVEALEVRRLLSTITVNTNEDPATVVGGEISLRSAIATANASETPTTINFQSGIFSPQKTIDLTSSLGELTVGNEYGEPITINGPSDGIIIDAGGQSRDFLTDGDVTMTNMAITGGSTNENGGGILNEGVLTLEYSTVSGNTARRDGGGIDTNGYDTYQRAGLTLIDDTISGNTTGNRGGAMSVGFDNYTDDLVASTATISDCTISGNTATDSGGGLEIGYFGEVTLANTVIAGDTVSDPNGSVDVNGNVTSKGYNFIGESDGSNGWLMTDITGSVATPEVSGLGPLQDNGGPTLTMLPQTGSQLIDGGSNALIPTGITTDQRGFARIYADTSNGDIVDIGAVEVQPQTITVIPANLQQAIVNQAQSFTLGSFSDVNCTPPFTVDVNWGDNTTDTVFTAADAGTISAQMHTYTNVETYTVKVTVSELSKTTGNPPIATNFATFDVIVSPGELTVTAPAGQTAYVGQSTSFALGTFAVINGQSPYSVDVNWGDNTSDTVFSETETATGLTTATYTTTPASHAFAIAGSYTITETVTDVVQSSPYGAYNLSDIATFTATVIAGATPSATTLNVSSSTIQFGQSVTLTATTAATNSPGTSPIPTGIFTFMVDSSPIGTVAVGSNGSASFSTSSLLSGNDSITVTYQGSAIYAASTSSPENIFVVPPTTTSLQTSTPSATTDQSVSLLATVAPAVFEGLTATGDVTFYTGTTVLGTSAVQNGIATLDTTSSLPVGVDPITAVYDGDANFSGSTSPAVDIVVNSAATVTVTSSSTPSKTIAQYVTLAATVQPSSAATSNTLSGLAPTGTVTFLDNGTPLGSVTVGSNGVASLPTSQPATTGVNVITADYSGDSVFSSSTSGTQDLFVTAQALVPVVTKVAVPTTVVSGSAVHFSVSANLTNKLLDLESGMESGPFSVTVYASTSTSLNTSGDTVIASVSHNARILHGKSVNVTVPITSFPASLAPGTYDLILQTRDAAGNTQAIATGTTVNVVAPVIDLSASFVSIPANVLKKGATLSLSTTGNTNDLSDFRAVIGFSTDSAGSNIVATTAGTIVPVKVLVRLGKASKIHVTGWQSLLANLPTGSYYLTVTLTDSSGNTARAVSPQAVSST